MKNYFPVLLLSLPVLLASNLIFASEQDGVQCPAGYSADISNNNERS
ncbi:hypothetical protein [Thiolinea disciformis]|nr:hypothetical protein [Thiolinea disciformis]